MAHGKSLELRYSAPTKTSETGEREAMMDEPKDPMTLMGEGMAQMHELFLSMLAADFTENQACKILGHMLAGSQNGGDDT